MAVTPALAAIAAEKVGPGLEVTTGGKVTFESPNYPELRQFDLENPPVVRAGQLIKGPTGKVRLDSRTIGGAASKAVEECGTKVARSCDAIIFSETLPYEGAKHPEYFERVKAATEASEKWCNDTVS